MLLLPQGNRPAWNRGESILFDPVQPPVLFGSVLSGVEVWYKDTQGFARRTLGCRMQGFEEAES